MALNRFNKGKRLFTIETEGMEGHKAADVFKAVGDAPLLMRAIFINKDNGYGESVSVVTTNSVIYFSKASLQTALDVREDPEAVEELNEKGAYFKIIEFESKKWKKKGYSFEFLSDEDLPAEFSEDDPVFKW